MKAINALIVAALLAVPAFVPAARAVVTQKQTYDTFAALSSGDFTNVSLSNDGQLELAPGMTNLASVNESIIWAMVQDKKGDVYFATGDQGKVYKLTPEGRLSAFFEPNAVMVHALAIDHKGRLYAATSPNGCVYRLDPDGRAEVYCNPGETYVWAMVFGDDGSLYLATGDHGKILRVPPSAKTPARAETYFESKEANITALAWDNHGNLLAGSSPHGYLYRIEKKKNGSAHGFVVFNSGDKEIKQIAAAPTGVIYVSTFVKSPKPEGPSGQTPITIAISPTPGENETSTIIRTAHGRLQPALKPSAGGVELLPGSPDDAGGGEGDDGGDNGGDPAALDQASVLSLINGGPNGGKSFGAIYRINTNGFCDRYWSVPDEAIFSMTLLPDGALLAGTGNKGRIYSISDANHWKLLQETGDGSQLAALLPDRRHPERLYAATSHPANIYRLDFSLADSGTYTSRAFDAKQKSEWGKLHPFGNVPNGAGLEFSTRSGNTPKPQNTWSVWSQPAPMAGEISVTSPTARYLQYRVEFKRAAGSPGDSARLRRVEFFYQNLNAPPVISRVSVHNQGFSVTKMPMPDMGAQPVSLNDLLGGDEGSSRPGSSGEEVIISMMAQPPLKMTKIPGYCTVVWRASDPNGDQLNYSVAIRAESDTNWTALVHKTKDTFYSFDTKGFPGGFYIIRVKASDLPSNTPQTALTAEAASEPFLINNAPPVLTVQSQTVGKDQASIVVNAVDAASVITSASYSLDGKDEVALRPDDLIFDSTNETFTIELNGLSQGGHSLLVRAADDAGNSGVLQANFEVK